MEQPRNRNVVPVGPGGTWGLIGRMFVMLCTGGMAYPNVFIEGMDCTAIQKKSEGNLYDKPGRKPVEGDSVDEVKAWGTQQTAASVAK